MARLIAIFFIISLCNYTSTNAQIINTIAGGGTSGLGDGGPATDAQLTGAGCLVFDKKENLYFADGVGSHRIRVINTSGIINTIAGTGVPGYSGDNGPAIVAQLNYPTGIAIDNKLGNIYIADWYNHNIRKIDSSGIITTFAGNGIAAFSGDGGLAINASLTPEGLCLDSFGNLYVIDTAARIRKIDPTGIITTIAGNGIYGFSGDGGLADTTEISPSYGIRVYENELYIGGEDRIREVNLATGIINTVAGDGYYLYNGEGIHADSAQFSAYTIDVDVDGSIYISDISNQRIRKINTTNIIYTVIGNGTAGFSGDGGIATLAEIHDPEGTVVDTCGNLYIADNGNSRIREVLFNPSCIPVKTGVNNITPQNISIYPNPTYDLLNIDNITTQTTYNLLNLVGAIIQQGVLKEGNNSISVQSLSSGMYMLELIDNDGNKTVKKIIKE